MDENSEAERNDLPEPYKQLNARVGLFPLPQLFLFALHPRPSPSRREGVNEAGLGEAREGPLSTGAGRSSRGGQTQGLAPLCPCLSTLPHVRWRLIPLWGGVGAPARVWALPAKTPPWRPRVCLLGWQCSHPGLSGRGRWGLGSRRAGLEGRGAERWEVVRCEPRAWGPVSSGLFLSLCRLVGSLTLPSLPLGDSGVKEFVV